MKDRAKLSWFGFSLSLKEPSIIYPLYCFLTKFDFIPWGAREPAMLKFDLPAGTSSDLWWLEGEASGCFRGPFHQIFAPIWTLVVGFVLMNSACQRFSSTQSEGKVESCMPSLLGSRSLERTAKHWRPNLLAKDFHSRLDFSRIGLKMSHHRSGNGSTKLTICATRTSTSPAYRKGSVPNMNE